MNISYYVLFFKYIRVKQAYISDNVGMKFYEIYNDYYNIVETIIFFEKRKIINMYEEYLVETECIDYSNPVIQEKVNELKAISESKLVYAEKAYCFVRDEIFHSWDAKLELVSKTASQVLINKTGICWTKSCLLAALLRAEGIPAGISYQLLTRADDGPEEGYIIHALNTVYIKELDKWIRIDARGNKETVNAQFSLDKEVLAFPVRPELGEIDYRDNNCDLDARLIKVLKESNSILDVTTDFTM